jgi:hypothetical protein
MLSKEFKMKSGILLSLLVLASQTTFAAAKETPVVLSKNMIVIKGSMAVSSTAVSALNYYIPESEYDASKTAVCTFAEDELSVVGTDRAIKVVAQQTKDSYDLSIPASGMRGNCKYVLDTIYLAVEDTKLMESLKIVTAARVAKETKEMAGIGVDVNYPNFGDVKGIGCRYSDDSSTLCYTANETDGLNYQIPNAPQTYTLDITKKE